MIAFGRGYLPLMIPNSVAVLRIFLLTQMVAADINQIFPYQGWICPQTCATCSYVSGCVTCHDNYLLHLERSGLHQQGRCLQSCPEGYYSMTRDPYKLCYKCPQSNCKKCSSASTCVQCSNPYVVHLGKCLSACPSGTVFDETLKHCAPEESRCLVGNWTVWSTCLKDGSPCGFKYGTQWRTRHPVAIKSPDDLTSCPVLSELRKCRLKQRHCPVEKTDTPIFQTKSERRQWLKRQRRRRRGCIKSGNIWRDYRCRKSRKSGNTKVKNLQNEEPKNFRQNNIASLSQHSTESVNKRGSDNEILPQALV